MESKKTNYDILFIGGVYEKDKEDEYLEKSKNGIQNAVNIHQWNFIRGIDSNNIKPVNILSARYVDSYPKYKDLYVKKNIWEHKKGAIDENIGFLNLKIIKSLIRKWKLICKAKKWSKNNCENKVIICYYPSIPQMQATIKAQKNNHSIKTVLIIPDIPKYMNLKNKKSFLKKCVDRIIEKKQEYLIQKFDGYILLTEEMSKILKITDKPYIVIEGIVDPIDIEKEVVTKKFTKKTLVYSGSLHRKYGLGNYLEAIKLIHDANIDFYIFGSGEMEEEIKKLAEVDSRIKFMGYRSRNEVLDYQRKATLLINPRVINEEFVKYSFPSKLIEYMVSGTPVVTSKLSSIPSEYDDKLFYIDGNAGIHEIKNAILKYVKFEEKYLREKAQYSKKFILNKKNYVVQGNKIVQLIDRILEDYNEKK